MIGIAAVKPSVFTVFLSLYETALATLLEQAAKQERSYSEFLEDLLSREMQSKSAKHLTMRLAMARLPFQKTLDLGMSLFYAAALHF